MEDNQPHALQSTSLQPSFTQPRTFFTSSESSVVSEDPYRNLFDPVTSEDQIGSLHLRSCSFDSFLYLTNSIYGFYDLVDGVLIKHEMGDCQHAYIGHYLLNKAQTNNHSRDLLMLPYPPIHVPLPNDNCGSQYSSKRRVRVPDFAIGALSTEDEIQNRSPKSKKLVFTLENPPEVVVEITSGNEKNDTMDKMQDYAHAEIPFYIIVNRDVHREGNSKHNPRITVCTLCNGEYDIQDYTGDESVHIRYIGDVSTNELLSNLDPNAALRQNDAKQRQRLEQTKQNVMQERMMKEQAQQDAREEKRMKEQAQQDAREEKRMKEQAEKMGREEKRKKEQAERKKEQAERKKEKYRERLRKNGIYVTDSSSSESSDIKQETKRQKSGEKNI